MKTTNSKIVIMAALSAVAVTGCYSRRVVVHERAPVRHVIVVEEPPAPQSEVTGPAPSRDHVWVPGYWTRSSNRWVWKKGHWERRPHGSTRYTPGHWEKGDKGWYYHGGYWQ